MVEVRWGHMGEAPKVYPLFKALVEAEGAPVPGPALFSRVWGGQFKQDAIYRFAVAELEEREPIGCVSLHQHVSTWKGAPAISLEDFFVAPEHRGKGIGAAMLKFAEEHAAKQGAARLELHVRADNLRAEALYLRQGWEVQPYRWMQKAVPESQRAKQEAKKAKRAAARAARKR